MAHSDDPPFLTVGTEVSAKYRGAFCEATIRIAKKLVKCKVSFSKGQSTIVSNDLVKGTLKVGSTVEVKQPDGQYQDATILKLTDQSTYTVVFDDGDERTLKRSSLCLKGGRHFEESESLDHLPLTDPENFGTPVMQLKKSSRKRRRHSSSPSRGEEVKRRCYPPDFPVGKAVFLENDRRRSSWLPAVIVPAHYFMDENEMSADTICVRSFKDGRFFAVTKEELHDFAPDKEPLLSMLEGEIQAMYMCKPAIERAMAYLDTGELPWDMDLFDPSVKYSSTELASGGEEGGREDGTSEEATAEKDAFEKKLKKFLEGKGTPLTRQPTLAQRDLDLFRLHKLVKEVGGMERVTQEMKWHSIYLQLGIPNTSNASYAIKVAYKRYLYAFELYEKGRVKTPKESPAKGGRRGRGMAAIQESDEEQEKPVDKAAGKVEKAVKLDKPDKPAKADKPTKPEKLEKTPSKADKPVKQEKPEKAVKPSTPQKTTRQSKPPTPQKNAKQDRTDSPKLDRTDSPKQDKTDSPKQDKTDSPKQDKTDTRPERPQRLTKSISRELVIPPGPSGLGGGLEREEGLSDGKSDSDMESQPDSASNGDSDHSATLSKLEGVVPSACGYNENDRILVWYGKGKNIRTYEAKIVTCEENEAQRDYLVHYNGWNNRYNEWIEEARIAGRLTSPFKGHRSQYAKFKKNKLPPAPDNRLKPPGSKKHDFAADKERDNTPQSSGKKTNSTGANKSSPVNGEVAPSSGRGRGPGRPPKKMRNSTTVADSSDHESSLSLGTPPAMPDLPDDSLPDDSLPDPPLVKTLRSLSPEFSPMDSPEDLKPEDISPPQESEAAATSNDERETEEEGMEVEAIVVKKEENSSWCSPPKPSLTTPSHSTPSTSSSSLTTAAVDSLLCSERLPSAVSELTPRVDLGIVKPDPDSLPLPLAPGATESPDDGSTSGSESSKALSDGSSSPDRLSSPSSSKEETAVGSPLSASNMQSSECQRDRERKEKEKTPIKTCSSSSSSSSFSSAGGSSSEKEGSPLMGQSHACRNVSSEGKRKGRDRESEEEYEERKKARRADMNFLLNLDELQVLSTEERISMIQDRLRSVQKKWVELKHEVANLDRRRRRARRREREAARTQANQSSAIECH